MPAQVPGVRLDPLQPQGPHSYEKTALQVGLLVARQVESLPLDEVAVDRFPGRIAVFFMHAHDRARTAGKYRFRLQKGQMRRPERQAAEAARGAAAIAVESTV